MDRRLFTAWMGPGEMTEARFRAYSSIPLNSGVEVITITRHTLADWVSPEHALHPAFNKLSAVHQCDYLRCYALHVFGGGYTDIKYTTKNWNRFFEVLEGRAEVFGAGYTEISELGVARVGGELEDLMRSNYTKLIGICAMIMKKDTEFTRSWYSRVNQVLDKHMDELIRNPAKHPQDHFGAKFTDGSTSSYPIPWTGLGGDILHPMIFDSHNKFLHLDMAPSFENYR